MMIKGKDVPRHYPSMTENDIFKWCRTGRLQPFRPCRDLSRSEKDPKSPKRWRRVFPSRESERLYSQLCGKYFSLIEWLKSRRTPDERLIKAEEESLTAAFKKSGRPIELPGIDQLRYNLFRRRQRETAEILRLFSEIEKIENELKPGKQWEDPSLTFSDTTKLLKDSFFRSGDIEKILFPSGRSRQAS